jgi:carboxypeptidase C (cathepsin A)
MDINLAFIRAGDIANDETPAIRELLEDGIRVLNLAGDADFACNFMASEINL